MRNWTPSRECKSLNKNVQILENAYREGDKAVLPTLLRVGYLADFYREALIADPEGILSAISQFSQKDQHMFAEGFSGGLDGLSRTRFDAVRAALMKVPDSSPNSKLAHMCLVQLETDNAFLLYDYFPAKTFVSPTSPLKVHLLSSELYAAAEKPLWPPKLTNEQAYRVLVSCSFGPPEVVTVGVNSDGSGEAQFRTTDAYRWGVNVGALVTLNPQQVMDLLEGLNGINFWKLPTESMDGPVVMDGCDWILEGVEDDKYHIVERACPGKTQYGQVTRWIFDLSGHKSKGVC